MSGWIESRGGKVVLVTPNLVQRPPSPVHQITIVNCSDGTAALLEPDSKILRTGQLPQNRDQQSAPAEPHPYSYSFSNYPGRKISLNRTIEDLGSKEINGVHTRGFKSTHLGGESDGEWNGKPIETTETWASDELAVTMFQIHTDKRAKREFRTTVTKIQFVEPDPALFDIPRNYKVNPPMPPPPGLPPVQKPTPPPK
jgi:hypothetical protein